MTAPKALACLLGLAAAVSCSSTNGRVDLATFDAEPRVAGAAQVYLDSQDESGENVTLAVRVRDLADIASADLLLEYDPERLVYFSWQAGVLLEQVVGPVTYDVFEQGPGDLRMQISRSAGSADAGLNDPVLVVLRFKVVAVGQTPAMWSALSSLDDAQGTPHPGVQFYAGEFSGS